MNLNLEESLALAKRAGADEVEVYAVSTRSIGIEIKRDTIELALEGIVQGLGIRAIVNGAVGYASTNREERISDAATLAVKTAKIRKSNPKWKELPSNTEHPTVKGLYDKKTEDSSVEDCINHALELIRGAAGTIETHPVTGKLTCTTTEHEILNTNNVSKREKTTAADAFIETISTRGGQTATAYDFEVSREIGKINFHRIGKNAAELSRRSLGPTKVLPETTTVLLQPMAVADLIEHTFISALSAENVQKNRSNLKGKLQTEIAKEELTVIDDGLMTGGLRSAATDDEGTPSQRTRVIEDGVLQTYLYDKYTADQDETMSTANAIRYTYNQTPVISTRNFTIQYPDSRVIEETDEGVIIHTLIGAHTANPITGDFSVEARNSFIIRGGEITEPIKTLMIPGNIFGLLQNISGAGSDVKNLGSIITPTLRIENTKIV